MADFLSVDPDGLADRSSAVAELARVARAIADRHATSLELLGACWGDDETGGKFHEVYGPARENLGRLMQSLPHGFESSADVLLGTAKRFGKTEMENTELGHDLHPRR
ncbi:WXG100 family type VII secretion target [Actinomadura rupiterrae]|uniref:WXG100 family type VII secretion target n=1 Tax=Actinomadura rupiterrae TaxID=559627 RepID=UPI0020A39C72|nr:hypothetical protein [Actinomadura rupiterrae]MCP2336724.1 hypothetical protein [Actinomadura rupiterrae]